MAKKGVIFTDMHKDNLISLCKKCHRIIEAMEIRKLKGKEIA